MLRFSKNDALEKPGTRPEPGDATVPVMLWLGCLGHPTSGLVARKTTTQENYLPSDR